jgi:hypothetical protein
VGGFEQRKRGVYLVDNHFCGRKEVCVVRGGVGEIGRVGDTKVCWCWKIVKA